MPTQSRDCQAIKQSTKKVSKDFKRSDHETKSHSSCVSKDIVAKKRETTH